ncbi:uncharacterized protein G2W53_040673 [Senna tora]|uniref:Uncharacterized protein n=1 Tax=Senna tora TaxID=362788 RepID=A0A834VY58_9FABA|nr:uncharacterized protein G2W53_040673 [Senna tora]
MRDRKCLKKKRHAPRVLPSTIANASGKHFLFPSCNVAISNVPGPGHDALYGNHLSREHSI